MKNFIEIVAKALAPSSPLASEKCYVAYFDKVADEPWASRGWEFMTPEEVGQMMGGN